MKSTLSIRNWWEPIKEPKGVAVAFDIFRCCTTIHTLAARGEKQLFVAPSLKEVKDDARLRGYRVFSELSQPVDCAERFDNSPLIAKNSPLSELPSLVATTTGTPSLFAARGFEKVFVGSLVGFSALVRHLTELNRPITLLPAALPDSNQIEDEITVFAMATALEGFANLPEFVTQCGEQAVEKIRASHRPKELSGKVPTGAEDAELALVLDCFDQVLELDFETGPFARVKRLPS